MYIRKYITRIKFSVKWTIQDLVKSVASRFPNHFSLHSYKFIIPLTPLYEDKKSTDYKRKSHIDPLGRPTITAGSDHCFFTFFLTVLSHFSKSSKTKQISSANSVPYWRDCASGWVDHDDICFDSFYFIPWSLGRPASIHNNAFHNCLLFLTHQAPMAD